MLSQLTAALVAGRTVNKDDCAAALEHIFSDENCSDLSIASFLTGLAVKGVNADQLSGFALTMRAHAKKVEYRQDLLLDTAGTGGGIDSFNISTTAAFVIAAAGVRVAKHGNRAMTSKCGSADVLEELGVNLNLGDDGALRTMQAAGISFMFAPLHHPAMKRVAAIRKQLNHRTIFNLLGPLTNPAGAGFQIIGAYSVDAARLIAQTLALLKTQRAWVVHSEDGMDELSPLAPSTVFEVSSDFIKEFSFNPADYIEVAGNHDQLKGGNVARNAEFSRKLLAGESVPAAARNAVILNAAAAIHLTNKNGFEDALVRAVSVLDSGEAYLRLEKLREASNA